MALELHPIQPGQEDLVQAVVASDPAYAERVTGLPPGEADSLSLLLVRPPDVPEEDKVVFGVWDGPALLGLVDVIRGYPTPETAYVGLLQVHADHQRRGVGHDAHALLLEGLREWPEITTLRVAVVETNRQHAERFWRDLGYRPVGDPVPWTYADLETTAQRYELSLIPPPRDG